MNAEGSTLLQDIRAQMEDLKGSPPADAWRRLAREALANWPQPGSGATLARWQALAEVARHDLSLAKLVEGHTDALAILRELAHAHAAPAGALWSTWAAESPGSRVLAQRSASGEVTLSGTKAWCSGAEVATHALLTVWFADEDGDVRGPQLAAVDLKQPGVGISSHGWRAVGMADSASADVRFDDVPAALVGAPGDYLARPGFWHGGAGVAACWFGGALALAHTLRQALAQQPSAARAPFRQAALGRVDVALEGTAALLREAAAWIDAHPQDDAGLVALRVRQSAEATARKVLDEVGRALGATPFCRDAAFARMAADLPVFIRQSHAERDDAALSERLLDGSGVPWAL